LNGIYTISFKEKQDQVDPFPRFRYIFCWKEGFNGSIFSNFKKVNNVWIADLLLFHKSYQLVLKPDTINYFTVYYLLIMF